MAGQNCATSFANKCSAKVCKEYFDTDCKKDPLAKEYLLPFCLGQQSFPTDIASIFSIDSSSGQIILCRNLDETRATNYTLEVTVVDGGARPRNETALVSILIGDVNEYGPKFTQPRYIGKLAEDAKSEETVVTVTAIEGPEDHGQNALITYSLLVDADGTFGIDSVTGGVTFGEGRSTESRANTCHIPPCTCTRLARIRAFENEPGNNRSDSYGRQR